MPKQARLAVVIAGLFATPVLGQNITSVVLYPGAATIERTAPVSPGQGRLELTGLPSDFDPRTLRVEADPGIRIGEIAVRDVARTTPHSFAQPHWPPATDRVPRSPCSASTPSIWRPRARARRRARAPPSRA